MTTDTEALVRRAYHLAEGDVLDVQGFIELFVEDGVFNGIGDVTGQESYRGAQMGDLIVWLGKLLPDIHWEFQRFNVLGDFWDEQGGATVRALLDAHTPVRALARRIDSAAARALTELGADLVAADLDDPAGLRAAFTGVHGVFAMTTPGSDQRTDIEVRHGHAIADAAAAAGVPRVVYSSVGGAERHTGIPHFDSKREVEEYLAARGQSTIFVRPVFFMDNFAQFLTSAMEDGTLVVRMPLPPRIPLQMIAAQDVGAVAAATALVPDRPLARKRRQAARTPARTSGTQLILISEGTS